MERLRGWSEAPPRRLRGRPCAAATRPLDSRAPDERGAIVPGAARAASLAAANKRIANLLRQVVEIDPGATRRRSEVDRTLFTDPVEDRLASQVLAVAPGVEAMLARGDYTEAMTALAGLRAGVDDFFDRVQVMTDDPAVRGNRLALLARIADLFLETATSHAFRRDASSLSRRPIRTAKPVRRSVARPSARLSARPPGRAPSSRGSWCQPSCSPSSLP